MEVSKEDIIHEYMDVILDFWGIQIDHEDGSTAPFTSLVMEEVCSRL